MDENNTTATEEPATMTATMTATTYTYRSDSGSGRLAAATLEAAIAELVRYLGGQATLDEACEEGGWAEILDADGDEVWSTR